ncbi:ATP-binding cassette domain-containing protein [Wenxinia saemankumensis]|uniref:Iron complex transport system ATP-binding protein n=1 Tax=Wenxinia saemankumensis TaxID=1447782 RepID=A0A1M6ACA7_9RHOB|nr:ATP-binding cassette domain-containing protein [Wenxinia saemankumensis]SHI34018.1 iron complex transport system ATP-binding protein [Wenxinia saemankumensis]
MIELSDLIVERDHARILDRIDLRFGQGGLTAMIGPNGAGKSTLLHAMAGLLPLAAGRVTVEGLDMPNARPRERARVVALMTQTDRVTARLNVEDLVSFGRWTHHGGRPGPDDRAAVDEALELFDLGPLRDRLLDTLSGGQRQRAFVAMAHAQGTPWMLLDEPLAALDPRYVRDLMERLHAISRPGPGQRSVVVVMHDLATAARYADRIVALKDGRLVTAGPAQLRLTGALLSDLFDTPLAVETVAGRRLVVPA